MRSERSYLPAAGRDVLLPVYDPLVRVLGFGKVADALLEQAALQPRHRVLDVGCGTGTLAVLIQRRYPDVDVTGIDPDSKALARAARKAQRAGATLRLDRGFADALPYDAATFDRVVSSMMFHHLRTDDKPKALAEWRRVLRPGGRLEFVDLAAGTHGFLAQFIHGHRPLGPVADDRMLQRLRDAGFTEAQRTGDRDTLVGRVAFYHASVRPGGSALPGSA